MEKKTKIDIYYPDYEVNDEDDDRMWWIKDAIASLRPVERKIFLTFTECGTFAETGRIFNVSTPTARSYVNEIREKIKKYVDDHKDTDDD